MGNSRVRRATDGFISLDNLRFLSHLNTDTHVHNGQSVQEIHLIRFLCVIQGGPAGDFNLGIVTTRQ